VAPRELEGILREFRSGLERLYGQRLANVVLFGSRARGEARPDSDIDLLVVLHGPVDPNDELHRVSPFKAALCLRHDVVISCVYISEEDFKSEKSPLLLNVRREGVPV
jgi:predicted nucleotidyltransferase